MSSNVGPHHDAGYMQNNILLVSASKKSKMALGEKLNAQIVDKGIMPGTPHAQRDKYDLTFLPSLHDPTPKYSQILF